MPDEYITILMEVDSQITTVQSVPLNCTLSAVVRHRLRTELHNRIALIVSHPPTQNVPVNTQCIIRY